MRLGILGRLCPDRNNGFGELIPGLETRKFPDTREYRVSGATGAAVPPKKFVVRIGRRRRWL